MHATISWTGTSSLTAGNLTLAAGDIIAILTGETNTANLSAMVDVGGTTIASTYPAGWTVYDADTGTADEWVLRAPTVDDASQYKYVKLRFSIGSSYMFIGHQVMEDWNPTTNTATNACTEVNSTYSRFPTNSWSNNTMDLMATARYIMMRPQGYTGSMNIAAMEISRGHPCLEIGSGRVPVIQMTVTAFNATALNTSKNARIPRILLTTDTDALDKSGRCTNGGGRPSTNLANEFDNITAEAAYDNANNPSYGIQQILFEAREDIGAVWGDSTVADVFIMQGGTLTGFEDRTLHTLDSANDRRCMWDDFGGILDHGDIRWIIRAE
jgi:hypothetical protein